MFSEKTLEEIRARTNIVEIVAEYVSLKKSGSGFTGLCPFHKEKTPSFHVHPLRQLFHCFGCHEGGNVFTFLRKIEGIPFPEVVQKLADRSGVDIEHEKRSKSFQRNQPEQKPTRAHQALDWAAKYFHYLLTEVSGYKFAREYLRKRGISEETEKKFLLGVSPRGWNTLRDLMLKRGFSTQELLEAGLIIQRQGKEGSYDRFRQRLMFPIRDPKGKVLGFGARLLSEEPNQPKYLNSAESPLFNKRNILYGAYENQREIRVRGESVIVEGYMDVVGLYDKNVRNSVATMGTALTDNHCNALKAMSRRVVTVFDSDAAGKDAWQRSVELLLKHGIFAKDLSLPPGKDPDEYVLENGAEKFEELCQKAPRQVTKLLKEIAAGGALSEDERQKWLEKLLPILIAAKRSPDRALLWDSVSLVLNVSIESLNDLVSHSPLAQRMSAAPQPARTEKRPPPPKSQASKLDPLDKEFLEASIRHHDRFKTLEDPQWKEGIRSKKLSEWLERFHSASEEEGGVLVGQLAEKAWADEGLQQLVSKLLLERESDGADQKFDETHWKAINSRILRRAKEFEIQALSRQIRLQERLGDEQAQLDLLSRLKTLRAEVDSQS